MLFTKVGTMPLPAVMALLISCMGKMLLSIDYFYCILLSFQTIFILICLPSSIKQINESAISERLMRLCIVALAAG